MKNLYEHCFDFVKQMLQVSQFRSILYRNDKKIFNEFVVILGMLAEDAIRSRLYSNDGDDK